METIRERIDDVRSLLFWRAILGNIVIVAIVFELLQRRYHLLNEARDNSLAAGFLAASFVLGIFYAVTQIVIS